MTTKSVNKLRGINSNETGLEIRRPDRNLVAGSGPLIFFKTTGNPDGYNT
ncbi:MAG: hypothetical protein NHB15_05925 [Methanosarcina barkeri]|nr:hypothetical protein [Methanosarcina sp. ERenArc_MAG2]